MFTGLIADLGTVEAIEAGEAGATLAIRTGLTGDIADGDSVAVNGVCLTATGIDGGSFTAEVMNETLARIVGAAPLRGVSRTPPRHRVGIRNRPENVAFRGSRIPRMKDLRQHIVRPRCPSY